MTPKQIQLQKAIMMACDSTRKKPMTLQLNWDTYEIDSNWVIHPMQQLSLSRVLTALGSDYLWCWYWIEVRFWYELDFVCERKLLKNDWSDATLFDQSQETQDILFDIICLWTQKS